MSLATPRRRGPSKVIATSVVLGGILTTVAAARAPIVVPARHIAADGLTFNYKISSQSTDKRRKEATDVNALVRLQGGNARMDFVEGKGPMNKKGTWVLMTSSPAQFAMVNDKDKQVMIMDPGQFGSGLGALMNNPMMKLTIKNAKFSFKDMGPGEAILGYKTRRVRVYNSSETEMKIMGMTQRSASSDSSDQWIAQGIEVDEAALVTWAKSFASGVKSTNPELAAEFAKYEKEYVRNGMALRSITWSTVTDGKGKAESDVTTMEVTELKKGAIDPSLFTLPTGYETVNLSEAMKSAQSAMDSASKGEEKKESKPSLKQGLGGLLKKKPPQP